MTYIPEHAVVWAEIPVSNLENAKTFYGAVLQAELKIEQMGPNDVVMLPAKDYATSIAGNLYEGKPSKDGSGMTIHLSIDGSVEAARDRVFDAGGSSSRDIVEMPFGRFAYCTDPDGNSIGLFEAA